MAFVIIKSDERRAREERVTRQFGHDPKHTNAQIREQMECIAAKDREIFKDSKKR